MAQTSSAFQVPSKRLENETQILDFRLSKAYNTYLRFISKLDESVRGKDNDTDCLVSEVTNSLLQILNTIDRWIDEIPPLVQPTRFGNKAFYFFCQRLATDSEELIVSNIPAADEAAEEVAAYLIHAFGDPLRIDYGTGHEMNFACFLCCLDQLGLISSDDYTAIVLKVFNRYIDIMRRLQTVYLLEPAGSRGVWGLDDFHFLPFLWGASQLIGHKYIKPKSYRYKETVEGFANKYMFLNAIQFINSVKTVSLAEHSPMLDDITVVPSWEKVNSGLLKMYKVEVLHKFAVVQHFLFGSILSLDHDPTVDEESIRQEEAAKAALCAHGNKDFPCCSASIRIPSALAAKSIPQAGPIVKPY
eukprot:GILJ01011170.1.p1 GENE.GILJ01011170.1~~GILJ01011170.1.p1  ORF type:complete len:376 (+),score=51.33 GILJ01011170.1:53-1129(+)